MLSVQAHTIMALAREAGAAIMHVYRNMATEVEIKTDGSPLTQADLAAHRLIDAGLHQTGLPILSEENADIPFAERQQWSRYWLVDPLDGTKEFIARNDEFTVNIALIDNHQPVLGVVYAPALELMYVGERGQADAASAAFRQRGDGALERIHCARWSAAAGAPLRAVGSRRHGLEKLTALLADLPYTLDNRGSALKICMVAEGDADLYPRMGPMMVPLQMPMNIIGLRYIGHVYDQSGSYAPAFTLFLALVTISAVAILPVRQRSATVIV